MAAATALTATASGLDIISALFGMGAADAQASLARSNARTLIAESEADIRRYQEETQAFKAEQGVRYLKSGVMLEGSPLAILDETTRVAAENISAKRARAEAEARNLRMQGKLAQSASRAALTGAITSTMTRAALLGDKMGWWGAEKGTEIAKQPTSGTGFGAGGKLDLKRGW